ESSISCLVFDSCTQERLAEGQCMSVVTLQSANGGAVRRSSWHSSQRKTTYLHLLSVDRGT
ncbi:MAG TPA: hypothetical protein VIJ25_16240, partial [Methylococcales bacterium]